MDESIDDFISKLEKRSTNEAWPEDRWQEEMEKHPFFMTKIPESGEIPPLLQGLQKLKYSPDENSPEELANAYKEDGNYNFKLKKYRMAVLSYTEGIKQRSNNVELNGQLYNNRAAAQFFLGNYRSCYNDCKCALKILPIYPKATKRLAQTCFKLGLYDECITQCDLIKGDETGEDILELRKTALKEKKRKDCEERRKKLLDRKDVIEKEKLLKALKERRITSVNEEKEEFNLSNPTGKKVHFAGERLVWPVLLLYPEYETSDIIENFHEDHTFEEEFSEIFADYADWDVDHKYSLKTIRCYYENVDKILKAINMSSTLGSILSADDFRIENGMPTFLILAKDSPTERNLLKSS